MEFQQGGGGVGEVEGLGVQGEFGLQSRDDRFCAEEAVGLAGEFHQGVGDALAGQLGGHRVGLGRGDDDVVLAV